MTPEPVSSTLEQLTHEIRTIYRRHWQDYLAIGSLLQQAKAMLTHGAWLSWLEDELPFSVGTAQRCMRAADLVRQYPSLADPTVRIDTSAVDVLTARSTPIDVVSRMVRDAQQGVLISRTHVEEAVGRTRPPKKSTIDFLPPPPKKSTIDFLPPPPSGAADRTNRPAPVADGSHSLVDPDDDFEEDIWRDPVPVSTPRPRFEFEEPEGPSVDDLMRQAQHQTTAPLPGRPDEPRPICWLVVQLEPGVPTEEAEALMAQLRRLREVVRLVAGFPDRITLSDAVDALEVPPHGP